MSYTPRARAASILDWVKGEIDGVPYRVTLRWAFYRCVQGLGLAKDDYTMFKRITARARKGFYKGWRPWTLADDTRELIRDGGGYDDFEEWLEHFKEEEPLYEKFSAQENLVMIWFEAEAMKSQFDYYVSPYHIPRSPFRGDPGIDFKWRIAKFLASLTQNFGEGKEQIVILYFGDYEPLRDWGSYGKGIRIPLDALKDIEPWYQLVCQSESIDALPIKYVRCGLNEEQVEEWDLPENPLRPDEYQWEALDDEQAGDLIKSSIDEYWDLSLVEEIEEREGEDGARWQNWLDDMQEEHGEA